MRHFHLQYFPRTGTPATNYGASFFSEIEAVNAAGLANATRGPEPGYYSIQQCRRRVCRPAPPDIKDCVPPDAGGAGGARVRLLPGVLN